MVLPDQMLGGQSQQTDTAMGKLRRGEKLQGTSRTFLTWIFLEIIINMCPTEWRRRLSNGLKRVVDVWGQLLWTSLMGYPPPSHPQSSFNSNIRSNDHIRIAIRWVPRATVQSAPCHSVRNCVHDSPRPGPGCSSSAVSMTFLNAPIQRHFFWSITAMLIVDFPNCHGVFQCPYSDYMTKERCCLVLIDACNALLSLAFFQMIVFCYTDCLRYSLRTIRLGSHISIASIFLISSFTFEYVGYSLS